MASVGAAWATRFPVYQIDFSAIASGKRVASTKRRIRWRFGFPNQAALNNGRTGTDCRGEEHDVTIIWSVTSGKRQISMDGREVHYSTSRSGMLDYSWATRGNHVIKVIAHAAPPLSATPGFRQYELLIDGQSFFTMPKVFEIGIRGPSRAPGDFAMVQSGSPGSYGGGPGYGGGGGGHHASAPSLGGGGFSTRDEEESDLQRAIQASIEESRRHLDKKQAEDNFSTYSSPQAMTHAPAPAPAADLLDLGGDFSSPGPPRPPQSDAQSIASYYSAPPTYGGGPPSYGAPPPSYQSPPGQQFGGPVGSPQPGALVPAQAPPGSYYYGAPPPQQSFSPPPGQAPPPAYNGYAPGPPQYAGGAPSYLDSQSQPADVFGFQSSPDDDPFAPKAPPPPPAPSRSDIASQILGAYAAGPSSAPTTPAGGIAPLIFGGSPGQPSPQQNGHGTPQANGHGMTLSMQPLAITAAEENAPKTAIEAAMRRLVNIERIDEPAEAEMKLTMIKKEEAKKAPKGKSKPLPPAAQGIIGQQASLAQIQQVKPTAARPGTEGVMKAPPANASYYTGALVVHGQGPPPLQQAVGFGAGAMLPNGGFNQQGGNQLPTPTPYNPQQGYHQQPQYPGQPQYR